ncbi:MAG: hypothetical protein ACLP59_33700 [Bryobacteraceae bacterium]
MKKLLFIASLTLAGVPGWAAPCETGTLKSYIALGSTGCVLGNLVVANFGYQAKASGGAEKITADHIMVTPILAPVGSVALEFTAPWGVSSQQSQHSGITYNVVVPAASPQQIEQVSLDGDGFQAGMFGSVEVSETVATPALSSILQVYLKCTDVCHSKTSAEEVFTSPVTMLAVSDAVTLQSASGDVSMTGFEDWFVTCSQCV